MATSHLGRSSFVPLLDSLEDRWCPAISVTKFNDVLIIAGDSARDVTTIQYNGANGNAYVDANGDGDFSDTGDVRHSGINQLMINMGGGNDILQFNLTGSLARALTAHVDLGEGDNTFNVNLGAGINAPAGAATFDVLAGAGADAVTLSLGGIAGGLNVNLNLGDGDNLVDVQGNSFISAAMAMRVETGQGKDTILGNFAGTLDCSSTGQTFDFVTKLGDGKDRVTLGFQDVLTTANLSLDTGKHNDRVALAFQSVECATSQSNTRLNVGLSLGNGNDKFTGSLNGVVSDLDNAAAASFSVQGGQGDDTMTFDGFSDLGRPPRGGALALEFKGDDGDDVMGVVYAGKQATVQSTSQGGALTREPSLKLRLHGGSGDDTIGLVVNRTDASGSPVISAKIYGQEGIDDLSFTLKGKGQARGKQVIDGGSGSDSANADGGVSVQNV